jgi:hypothetical protein
MYITCIIKTDQIRSTTGFQEILNIIKTISSESYYRAISEDTIFLKLDELSLIGVLNSSLINWIKTIYITNGRISYKEFQISFGENYIKIN